MTSSDYRQNQSRRTEIWQSADDDPRLAVQRINHSGAAILARMPYGPFSEVKIGRFFYKHTLASGFDSCSIYARRMGILDTRSTEKVAFSQPMIRLGYEFFIHISRVDLWSSKEQENTNRIHTAFASTRFVAVTR